MSSTRLPGKMLMELGGMPLALWVLRRCALSRVAHGVALITSRHSTDDALVLASEQAGFACFRGDLENVRDRYIQAGKHFNFAIIGRVCGDSPFVDVEMLDTLLRAACTGKADYLRVVDTLPGFVSEVFTLRALEDSQGQDAITLSRNQNDVVAEHVTTTLRQHPERNPSLLLPGLPAPAHFPSLTVDTAKDMAEARQLVAQGCDYTTTARHVLSSVGTHPIF